MDRFKETRFGKWVQNRSQQEPIPSLYEGIESNAVTQYMQSFEAVLKGLDPTAQARYAPARLPHRAISLFGASVPTDQAPVVLPHVLGDIVDRAYLREDKKKEIYGIILLPNFGILLSQPGAKPYGGPESVYGLSIEIPTGAVGVHSAVAYDTGGTAHAVQRVYHPDRIAQSFEEILHARQELEAVTIDKKYPTIIHARGLPAAR